MNNKPRAILLLAFTLLTACSRLSEAPGKLELILGIQDDFAVLNLVNNSTIRQPASSGYTFSSGMSNIHAIIVDDFGGVRKFCNPVDDRGTFWKNGFIAAGKSIEIWRETPQFLAMFFCLGKGRYTLAFAYQRPSGELLFSNQAELVVTGESIPGTPYLTNAYIEIGKTPAMIGSDENPSPIR